MRKFLKYTCILLTIFLITTIFFYLKPALNIKQCKVSNDVPVKIGIYSNNEYAIDSLIIYIPYKIEVSNNRLKNIKLSHVTYKENYSSNDLNFDMNGFLLISQDRLYTLDGMLEKNEFLNYWQLYNNKIVFPFFDKEFYIYKPFLISKTNIGKRFTSKQRLDLIKDFSEHQSQKLFYQSKFKIDKKIIDSLYREDNNRKVIFNFEYGADKYSNTYQIHYYINTEKQKLIDYSKMSQKQLLEHMRTRLDFEK
jgi:hypothetical protein